jgi:DNA-binding SARP family transcriptional activator/tetratricopeptide (TPR) repeat protein
MDRTTGRSGEAPDADAGTYVFDVLGPFRLKAPDGQDVTPLGRKTRGLLAYLAMAKDMTAPRERLMALLWSERGEEQARASLRQCLHELRPLTSGDLPPLVVERHLVGLAPARIETDLVRFEALVADSDAAALAAGLDGFTRPLVEDLDDLDPAFDEWLAIARTRFEDRQVRRLSAVIQHALAAGAIEPARDLAMALAARHPTDEEVARLAMTASHGCGQRDAVRRIYQRLEAALQRELGEAPSPETRQHLDRLMKNPVPVPAGPSSPPEASPPRLEQPQAFPTDTVRPPQEPRFGRATIMIAATILLVAALVGAAFVLKPPQPGAGEIVLVRPLRVPPNDTAAQAFRQGLTSDLARAVLGKDAALRIADDSGSGNAGDDRKFRFVFDGEARTDDGELRVTVGLRSASSNEFLWSGNFSSLATEADALRQQAAVRIARSLTCALGARHRGGAVLADGTLRLYLTACDAEAKGDSKTVHKLLKAVVAEAPDSSRTWSDLAISSAFYAQDLVGADAEAMQQEARAEADRALELDPHNGGAYFARALAMPGLEHWQERVELLRAGLAVEPESAELNDALAEDLASVGRLHEALTLSRQSVASDPLSASETASFIFRLSFDGRLGEAREVLADAERLWPQDEQVFGARLSLAARHGDPGGALALLHSPKRPSWVSLNLQLWEAVLTALQTPTEGNMNAAIARIMERVRIIDQAGDDDGRAQLVHHLAVLGRMDDAFALANRGGKPPRDGGGIWFRSYMAPFRADPRFMPLVYHQGLVDIWVKTGKWPDFCVDKTAPYDCKAEARRLMAADHRAENLPGNR